MLKEAIFHKTILDYCYSYDKDIIIIKMRAKKNDLVKCTIVYGDRYDWSIEDCICNMDVFASDGMFDYWQAEIKTPIFRMRYVFKIEGYDEVCWFSEEGFENEKPHKSRYFQYPYLRESEIMKPPSWVGGAIFYEIFPDRFYNHNGIDEEKWYSNPKRSDIFGGSIKGLTEKIPYLIDLGINAIYLTPIFKATTNHRYDTIDYYEVDSRLGTNDDFKELVNKLHQHNIRIILDGVFNHCSYKFFAFEDLMKNGRNSKYKNWFRVYDFNKPIKVGRTVNYECYGQVPFMPKLMTDNKEVREYFLNVAEYWIKEFGIDGWRMDVSNEVAHIFWVELRRRIKDFNKEIYIVGETWSDSTEWVNGDQFDAVMNYKFTKLMVDFIAVENIYAWQFKNGIENLRSSYKKQVQFSLMNLLDSHDTPRFLTLCGNNVEKLKLAAMFQLTYTGTPMIFYGDEVGIDGNQEPSCRKGMLWNKSRNIELHKVYKKFIKIRKSHKSLTNGEFRSVYADESIYVFKRYLKKETIYVVCNKSWERNYYELNFKEKNVHSVCSLMNGEKMLVHDEKINLNLAPYGFYILKVNSSSIKKDLIYI